MGKPFFSIVLSTKNRPELLRDAIRSVLLQNFNDYELIISDNFNDGRTKNVINEFINDPRILYIRTNSELNIPDHWEFATKHASGEYILILTDRAFLVQGALQDIHRSILDANNPEVLFWKYGYFDEKEKILQGEKSEEGIQTLDPATQLKRFGSSLNARLLPRPHVGCHRADLADIIRKKVGRVYRPYGPDYTSSLLFLAYSNKVIFIPRPLVVFQGASVSSGTMAQTTVLPYLQSLNMKDPYEHVPIKAPINGSLLFNDFLKIQHLAAESNFKGIEIDWVFYFGMCYQELKERALLWGVRDEDQNKIWGAWKEALAARDEQTQRQVRKEIKKRRIHIIKSYIRSTSFGRVLLKIKSFFLGKPTRLYSNVFVAGGFTDTVIKNRPSY